MAAVGQGCRSLRLPVGKGRRSLRLPVGQGVMITLPGAELSMLPTTHAAVTPAS